MFSNLYYLMFIYFTRILNSPRATIAGLFIYTITIKHNDTHLIQFITEKQTDIQKTNKLTDIHDGFYSS